MAEYFSSDHFNLLKKWKGRKRDESSPEQNQAYDDLKKAYELTATWAEELKARLFPMGIVKVRKRPTSQANTFLEYNWARIYPSEEAPEELAYTVGIDAIEGFVVKIDTVQANSVLRSSYEALRGPDYAKSPIVATLPIEDGLSRSLEDLVTWSARAIKAFGFSYEEVVAKLGLGESLSNEDLLRHFDAKPAFKTFRASWSDDEKALFCRLARIVHAARLDWWHTGRGVQVRCGRKNPANERAVGVLAVVMGIRSRKIVWRRPLGDLKRAGAQPLTEDLVSRIEVALTSERQVLDDWFAEGRERLGLWPDELRDDPPDAIDDADDTEETSDAPTQAFNRIYYGPPGTGKTYQVLKLLKRSYVQSLTAISPDEWRRQFIAENIPSLTWWEAAAAALYDLGGKANVTQLLSHPFIQALAVSRGRTKNLRPTLWKNLQEHTVTESTTVHVAGRLEPPIFDKTVESTWHFAGEWLDAGAELIDMVELYRLGPKAIGNVQRYSFVTFHQSYGYEEFVEGLRPVLESDSQQVRYEIRPGVFKELCRKARLAPNQRFAMVIDEINRGNISKIFGELITLIESDKREGAEQAVSITLPFSGESFSVPANVDIIGTMNTADRSLALLDTALRRRFDFEPVMPDTRDDSGAPLHALRVTLGEQVIDIPKMLAAINVRIEALYDNDHRIGHAYFTALHQVPDGESRFIALSQLFRNRILPLLEEYFFEDWQKIQLVLADNQKEFSARFIVQSADHDEELSRLFGKEHGLDAYTVKRRFEVQDSAFSKPGAYISIYQSLTI